MQIFVKFGSEKPIVVDANGDDTIMTVVRSAFQKLKPDMALPASERIKCVYGGKPVHNLEIKLADLNVQNLTTLNVAISPDADSVVNADVLEKLQTFLRIAAAELGPGEITFIGIGSYDYAHGEESIKRQQCPDRLLAHCLKHRVDLNIILVDPGFANADQSSCPQIYNSAGWGLHVSENEGKVRRYHYAPATAAGACDVWLTVFATGIREYGSALTNAGKSVAGIDVPATFTAAGSQANPDACVISGNFYSNPTDSTQYSTLGSRAAIEGAGFTYNP